VPVNRSLHRNGIDESRVGDRKKVEKKKIQNPKRAAGEKAEPRRS
jgi:hypothetical protein